MSAAWTLGGRRLVAATCLRCGKMFEGKVYGRHVRKLRDSRPYIDRRCTNCKWGARVKGKRTDA